MPSLFGFQKYFSLKSAFWVCILIPNVISIFAPYYEVDDTAFITKIGNTTYEVSTHFNAKGKETVFEQFKNQKGKHRKICIKENGVPPFSEVTPYFLNTSLSALD